MEVFCNSKFQSEMVADMLKSCEDLERIVQKVVDYTRSRSIIQCDGSSVTVLLLFFV